jgi:hypothetical protein
MRTVSKRRGIAAFVCEVTNVAPGGFWLLVDDKEYHVPFSDYPVFQKATIEQICSLERQGPTQIHWPSLDADIELEALEYPERFPLKWTK